MEYSEFLQNKIIHHAPSGFEVDATKLNPMLFDWQKAVVRWALFTGKCALFEACGLGKTPQQLEWANQICKKTGGNVLILAPLAVAGQTVAEGAKFGITVKKCRTQADVMLGINITNYEMLDHFDADSFVGVVLDESSILKSFMGKTKTQIIATFKNTPYKLCCTATPSPNDSMELLNHSDFLDVMPSNEALSRWFINDTMNFGTYRLKGHAVKEFWQWVSSWAVAMNLPSDIGYPDNGFILPDLKTILHTVEYDDILDYENGQLFKSEKVINASNLFKELRETTGSRARIAADLVNDSGESWVVWCNTNYEADALKKKIPCAVEIRGSMPLAQKESILERFSAGNERVLIGKPSMLGFGLNWQHVHNSVFVGVSYSFEQRYQALRRLWRFGQKSIVKDHVVLSHAEKQVFMTVQEKERRHMEMQVNMVNDVKNYSDLNNFREDLKITYDAKKLKGKDYEIIIGDSVQEIKKIPDDSIHFSIFSPPFSSLYIYSDFIQDMGNSKDDAEFFRHFGYLVPELKRVTVPGRLCAVHCKDLVDYKGRDGMAGLRDFPGDIIRLFEQHGWKYHSRVTIWKDPVIEMQRTKAQGLLHKQIKKDSSLSRQGLPDYLIIFRKWPESGETSGPEPVEHPEGFKAFVGFNKPSSPAYILKEYEDRPYSEIQEIKKDDDIFSIHVWQRYASPVWFDIQQTNVLNCRVARDNEDEKHICPLQIDVIQRAVHLWTNRGDTVFTPFAGIGSELYGSVELGRKAIGIELKETYADQAHKFLQGLENKSKQLSLF